MCRGLAYAVDAKQPHFTFLFDCELKSDFNSTQVYFAFFTHAYINKAHVMLALEKSAFYKKE
jgi:hypothetical protein